MPEYQKSHIVYEFCSPVRNNKYSGKTERNFGTPVQGNSGSDKTSLFYKHLLEWEHFNYVVNLRSLPPSSNLVEYPVLVKIAVYSNIIIIDSSQIWIELYFLESLHIKWKKLKVKCGIKATKELV